MALPMVHLIAAYNWAKDREELFTVPEYYLGAISPDAIHVRDGKDKSRKDEIHLYNWKTSRPELVKAYWKEHNTPFDIGYGIHVLLDGYWTDCFHRDLPGLLSSDGKPIPELYYNDTAINDFRLYRQYENKSLVFEMLEKASTPSDHPLLSEYEIKRWNEIIRTEFYEKPLDTNRPIRFFTEDYINHFLEKCDALFDSAYTAAEIK